MFMACDRNKFCYFAFKNSFLDFLEYSCGVQVLVNESFFLLCFFVLFFLLIFARFDHIEIELLNSLVNKYNKNTVAGN